MSTTTPSQQPLRLSVPPKFRAPRPVTDAELATLRAVADVLIPATDKNPAATQAPDFDSWLHRAVDARADSFGLLTEVLAELDGLDQVALDAALRRLHSEEGESFVVLSAVVAGAWLLVPEVKAAVGYPGQKRDVPRLEEAADQISDGILDPVLDRGFIYTPAPE
ncbi:hypothetical protein [Streptomyces sp. RP5T]|uniref:hypothetical protein n=1 Tax=Streptomyces sp. RP5T TaxID=2490848 RepID=UPI000F653738|nr:hypothetical protein [Streptomyces sp. RP5T]RRR86073.1 hypothetical protein EHS43_05680 [Streptomyces sp. RP5T]